MRRNTAKPALKTPKFIRRWVVGDSPGVRVLLWPSQVWKRNQELLVDQAPEMGQCSQSDGSVP